MSHATRIAAVVLLSLTALAVPAPAGASGDDYVAGYAAAVVERDLGLEGARVDVVAGTAHVTVRDLGGVAPQQIEEALARIDGIERVEVHVDGETPQPAEPPAEEGSDEGAIELLPRRELFDPLLADPRQPHFSASALWYLNDPELNRVGAANFGETFALLGGPVGDGPTRWELGILGGVFTIFDLDAPSSDLVNSDFWIAPTFSLRRDAVSGQLRVYHQSSHLGDEFLLRNRVERVNLSYEGVDLIGSIQLHPALRVYGGGGAILLSEPEIEPLSAQAGVELQSPVAFLGGHVRPIAAGDFQFRQDNDWRDEISAVAGLQLENPELSRLRLQILFQYFRGNSPNGQFFERRIEYLGVGAHLHF